jgi:hypothetical protein
VFEIDLYVQSGKNAAAQLTVVLCIAKPKPATAQHMNSVEPKSHDQHSALSGIALSPHLCYWAYQVVRVRALTDPRGRLLDGTASSHPM